MADMATYAQVEEAWEVLQEWVPGEVLPLSYMNSSADIKAFTGREGGAICTSSNAGRAMAWSFERRAKVLFLPDQHLGRNTAMAMGLQPADCVVWDPHRDEGGLAEAPAGSRWAVGTELNLVHRLATTHPDKTVAFLDRTVCFCSTMNRIDLPHLVWALEELAAGRVPNRVAVAPEVRANALLALERMLTL
jgi:quinolinate synthase